MQNTKPNIIYIFADQLRADAIHRRHTPNINALAHECCELENAVSGHPVCAPYRASLFTGKHTTSTGMVINEIRLNPAHHPRPLAKCLTEAGYNAEYIGKWHMFANVWGDHLNPQNSFVPKGADRLGFDGFFAHYGFHHEYVGESNYYHLDTPEKIFHEKYEPDAVTDMACERLSLLAEKPEPFALFFSLGTPHDPWEEWNVPQKYLDILKEEKFELPANYLPENDPHADAWARLSLEERAELPHWMRVYHAMVANLDENIGRLVEHIKSLGLWENSIVVFTSDHGEMFGAHGRRAKNIFYEEAIRVPFLLRLPKGERAGERDDVLLNTVDIMPTLLSLCGLEIPPDCEGADVFAKPPSGQLLMCTGPTADFYDGHEWRAWRTKRWTYAQFLSDEQELLFDNIADPLQTDNLAERAEYAALKAELRGAMLAEMAKIGDEFCPNTYYKEHWVSADRLILRTAKS